MSGSPHHRKLILVKHAEPVVDPRAPPNRWELSERGELQGSTLAERLRRYDTSEVIVASEEPKAVQTAFAVARRLGRRVETFPGLHEHDRTGAPFGTRAEFERAAETFFENPGELVWGNETAEEALARFTLAMDGVLGRYPTGDLIVVSHGTVITLPAAGSIAWSPPRRIPKKLPPPSATSRTASTTWRPTRTNCTTSPACGHTEMSPTP